MCDQTAERTGIARKTKPVPSTLALHRPAKMAENSKEHESTPF